MDELFDGAHDGEEVGVEELGGDGVEEEDFEGCAEDDVVLFQEEVVVLLGVGSAAVDFEEQAEDFEDVGDEPCFVDPLDL